MSVGIPLLLAMELVSHGEDDLVRHNLRIGVVGMQEPIDVDIVSDFYQWPRIEADNGFDGILLPLKLRHHFIFKCFDAMVDVLGDSNLGEWILPDATSWLEVQFLSSEAATLITELRQHVPPGSQIDLSRCTAFTPVPHRLLRGGDERAQ